MNDKILNEDFKRLGITFIAVIVIIWLLVAVNQRTGFLNKGEDLVVETDDISSVEPEATPEEPSE